MLALMTLVARRSGLTASQRNFYVILGMAGAALADDEIGIGIDGNVGNLVLVEHRADEMADAPEAGNDDAGTLVVR